VALLAQLFVGWHDDAGLTEARQEHVDVLGCLDDVVLGCEVPTAGTLGHRARRPNFGEEVVRDVRPFERIDLD
jgi:hypothetical protein